MIRRTIGLMGCVLAVACGGTDPSGGGSETGFLETGESRACLGGEDCGAVARDEEAPAEEPLDEATAKAELDEHSIAASPAAATSLCDAAELVEGIDETWTIAWNSEAQPMGLASCGNGENPPVSPGVVVKWVAPFDSSGEYWVMARSGTFAGVLQGTLCRDEADTSSGDWDANGCALFDPASSHRGGGGFSLSFEQGEVLYFTIQHLDRNGGSMPETGEVELTIERR